MQEPQMAGEQGGCENQCKCDPASRVINPASDCGRALGAEKVKGVDRRNRHQAAKGVAIGKASGPVTKMGLLGKPIGAFKREDIGKTGKCDLQNCRNYHGPCDYSGEFITSHLRASSGQHIDTDQPQNTADHRQEGGWVKGKVRCVERGRQRWPDRCGLHDQPYRQECAGNANLFDRSGQFHVAEPSRRQQPDAGQDGQNRYRPRSCAAQHDRGQNDLGCQAKCHQSLHQRSENIHDFKLITIAEFFGFVPPRGVAGCCRGNSWPK